MTPIESGLFAKKDEECEVAAPTVGVADAVTVSVSVLVELLPTGAGAGVGVGVGVGVIGGVGLAD